MRDEEHYRKLERLYVSAPCNRYYEPRIAVSRGKAEVVIPVRGYLHHPADAVHGAAYFKVADDSAFFAVNSLVDDVLVLTVQLDLHFLRPVSRGVVEGRGRVVRSSRRLWVAESVVLDGDDREIGRAIGTFVRSRTPLTPRIGYRTAPADPGEE